jgi:hypothetical protein
MSAYRIKCCAACDSHPADHRHVCMAHLPPDNEHKRVVMGKLMSVPSLSHDFDRAKQFGS